MLQRGISIALFAGALCCAAGCNLKDPVARPAFNNGANNGTNNGVNNGTNNGVNNGSNNGTNNGANNGSNNGSNNGVDMGNDDMGDDAGMMRPPLPSSASPTGGTLQGQSPNYKIRMQIGAPQASPRPSSQNNTVEIGPPAR